MSGLPRTLTTGTKGQDGSYRAELPLDTGCEAGSLIWRSGQRSIATSQTHSVREWVTGGGFLGLAGVRRLEVAGAYRILVPRSKSHDLTGWERGVRWDVGKPDGQPRRARDTSRALDRIRFVPKTSLENGLRRTIDWFGSTLVDAL